ncbi:hypothetical protein [Streptacidiphilus cavernicola]|uniref:Uncharacterized protein n=1 Tax=Streptacidiphilus cavernicola TaxID=3342716 RepID=A0ABV6VV33_9ACTN
MSTTEENVLYGAREMQLMNLPYVRTLNRKEIPADGCLGEVNRSFTSYSSYSAGVSAASEIATDSFVKSTGSAAVKSLFKRWSSCMMESGYEFSTPMEPLADKSFNGPVASKSEIAAANSDISCKQRIDLLNGWFKVESAIQDQLIRNKKSELEHLKIAQEEKIKEAQSIIANHQ